jgi:hypothetical protein
MDIRDIEYIAPSQIQLGMRLAYTFDATHRCQTVTGLEMTDTGSVIVTLANGVMLFVAVSQLVSIEI